MVHETPLISTIVAALVLAFILGTIANRFRLPPLVGYLLAGVLVGPYTPGFVADAELALELSEIGVILLMFGVGLHFSLKDLLSVRSIALPGALVQIAGATLLGLGLALLLGWSVGAGLVFGLALSVASTVVLLKALQDRHMIDSERGRIAVGWLIVEDIAMVLALVLIPAIANVAAGADVPTTDPFISLVERVLQRDLGVPGVLAVTVVKLAAFVGFMLIVGRRVIPSILHFTAHTGSRELFRLAVLAIALGVAAGAAYLFGVSLALGAFFAGMILSESELSHRAAQESLPLRDAFAVLFFVSVGMLFDPTIILRDPLPVLATLFIIVLGKSVFAFMIVLAFKRPVSTALVISASLAQIGEFSFILAEVGVGLNILPEEGRDLILSGAILSIILNPLTFLAADRLRPHIEARLKGRAIDPEAAPAKLEPSLDSGSAQPEVSAAEQNEKEEEHRTALNGHAILAGYGRVGTVVGEGLQMSDMPFLLIEDAEGRINAARTAGIEVIVGNAATSRTLERANVQGARTMIIAIPNAFEAGQVAEQCRRINPKMRIVARAHSDEEEAHLKHLGADQVIMGEREIALGLLGLLQDGRADATAESFRNDGEPVTSSVPNPFSAVPPSTSSPVEAALTEESYAEEEAPEMFAGDLGEPTAAVTQEAPAAMPAGAASEQEAPAPEPLAAIELASGAWAEPDIPPAPGTPPVELADEPVIPDPATEARSASDGEAETPSPELNETNVPDQRLSDVLGASFDEAAEAEGSPSGDSPARDEVEPSPPPEPAAEPIAQAPEVIILPPPPVPEAPPQEGTAIEPELSPSIAPEAGDDDAPGENEGPAPKPQP